MNTSKWIDESSLLQNSAAGRLAGMATRGTKKQVVAFVLFVVRQNFWQVAPDSEKGRISGLPASGSSLIATGIFLRIIRTAGRDSPIR